MFSRTLSLGLDCVELEREIVTLSYLFVVQYRAVMTNVVGGCEMVPVSGVDVRACVPCSLAP